MGRPVSSFLRRCIAKPIIPVRLRRGEFESLLKLQTKQKGYPEGYPFYLAQKERLEGLCPSHSLRSLTRLCSASPRGVRVSLKLQTKQKGYPSGYPFYLAQKERLEGLCPSHSLRSFTRLCSASPRGVRVSLKLQTKQKGYPSGYPFYLAQKERLELSRRFPDLRP